MLVPFPEGCVLPFCRNLLDMHQLSHIAINTHLSCIKMQKTELPLSCGFSVNVLKLINRARNSGGLYKL